MISRVGRILFGVAAIGWGVNCFVTGSPVSGLEPILATFRGQAVLAYLTGLVLVVAGGMLAANVRPRAGAIVLAGVLTSWLLLIHLPRFLPDPLNGAAVTTTFEVLALAGAAWMMVAGPLADGVDGRQHEELARKLFTIGRYAFGASFPVFGVLHYVYADLVASLVPSWLPAHLFWAYFTGTAHIAAGISILINRVVRLAMTLLATMFYLWVLILHIPRVVAHPMRNEWDSLFVAVATGAGALILLARTSLARSSSRRAPLVLSQALLPAPPRVVDG